MPATSAASSVGIKEQPYFFGRNGIMATESTHSFHCEPYSLSRPFISAPRGDFPMGCQLPCQSTPPTERSRATPPAWPLLGKVPWPIPVEADTQVHRLLKHTRESSRASVSPPLKWATPLLSGLVPCHFTLGPYEVKSVLNRSLKSCRWASGPAPGMLSSWG